MRSSLVFILVALFAFGGLLLAGCKKKEETAETVETAVTAELESGSVEEPDTGEPETGETAGTGGDEEPTEEGTPEEGGEHPQ